MNGAQEFAAILNRIENEVLNLKTAHQRPLGTLNFFQKNLNFTVDIEIGDFGVYFNVIVNVETPTAKPPIVQTGWEIPNNFYDVTIVDTSVNGTYDQWTYTLFLNSDSTSAQSVPFKVGAISSQPILNITWEYTNPWI